MINKRDIQISETQRKLPEIAVNLHSWKPQDAD